MGSAYSLRGIRNIFTSKAFLVAVVWLLGLVSGCLILSKTSFISLMRSEHFVRTSIVDLLISLAAPLLISCILLRFHIIFLLPFVFLKAFSFVCCYGGVLIAFGTAGWLVSALLCFSDFFVVGLLLLLWFDFAFGRTHSTRFYLIIYVAVPAAIGCFDYFVLSPFVSGLLRY